MKNKFTTQEYWEDYYKGNRDNSEHIIKVCSKYDIFWEKLITDKSGGKKIIEIGGYPGRYLAYLAAKYEVMPICLDYNSDVKQIKSSFKSMNVDHYEILQEDFINYTPMEKYNYVLSNGFIEHFKNYNEILDLHLDYIEDDGKLFVMIPNMRGYIRIYKFLVDNYNLKLHNLECMTLKVFENFASRNKLKIIHLSYFGGFPYNVHQKLNIFQKLFYKGHHILFKKVLNYFVEKYPNPYFSSSIIAIFKKE